MNKTNKDTNYFIEIYGWYGAVAIVLAYALVTSHKISSDSALFHMLNLTGSIAIVLVSFRHRAYQPMTLNVFRSLVAIAGLITIFG